MVRDISDGTSKPTISPKDLCGYYVNYYPINEQNIIAKNYESSVIPALNAAKVAIDTFDESLNKVL